MKPGLVLSHVVLLPPDYDQEQEKWVGIYTTQELSLSAIARLKNQPGFCEHPNLIDYEA